MLVSFSYICSILILTSGLYIVITAQSLLKKLIGLSIFQAAIMLFYIIIGKINDGVAPILKCLDFSQCPERYVNPLPQVFMLTAIVVSISTLAVGLSLLILINEKYNSIDETVIKELEDD